MAIHSTRVAMYGVGALVASTLFLLVAAVLVSDGWRLSNLHFDDSDIQRPHREWAEFSVIDLALPERKLGVAELTHFASKPKGSSLEPGASVYIGRYRGAVAEVLFCSGCSSSETRLIVLRVEESLCGSFGGVSGIWDPLRLREQQHLTVDFSRVCVPVPVLELASNFHIPSRSGDVSYKPMTVAEALPNQPVQPTPAAPADRQR